MHAEAASDPTRKRRSSSEGPFPVRVRLLGGFSVWVGSRAVSERAWRLKKAASLIKLLALAPAHRLHREQVMDLFWPDHGKKAASNNLRRVIYSTRKILDPALGSRYLASEGESLVLCPRSDLWVDAKAFEEAAAMAQSSQAPGTYGAALDLYTGDLLPDDRYEPWAEERREKLRQTRLELLVRLADLHEKRGEYGPAIESLRQVLIDNPTLEEAHAGLMRLYTRSGWPGEAIKQYARFEEHLRRELGAEPGASTRHLREDIVAGDFPLSSPTESATRVGLLENSTGAGKHNLPVPKTTFVGREREIVEIKRALAMTRLLTLTGAGGSGKTRLALKVAGTLIDVYPDGIWLVEFAGLTEGELVAQAVAQAIGVREQPGRQLEDTLVEALRAKRMLVVLDNCEHLADAAASLVEVLLNSCPHLRILATSREPLDVEGEALWRVHFLTVPGTERPRAAGELTRYDAVRLLLDRVRPRLPDFDLTLENAPEVTEVCRKLEGIPLAIELAAARVGVLSVKQIAARLEDPLGLLSAGRRTAVPRQKTLRGTLDWSYGLLGDQEQVLFRRFSTFAGGWTVEAAQGVGAGEGLEESNVLDLLSGLVNKSLVETQATEQGELRYRMLEPVRRYAQEKLEESEETDWVWSQHAAWYLDLAERAESELRGPRQVEWLKRLEEDNDNLRAAMAWLLEDGDIEAAVRLAWALWIFWLIHGHQGEGRRWIEAALAKSENLSAHTRAKALWVQASTYYGLGNYERLERICEEAAALFRHVGDNFGLAYVVALRATTMIQQGDAERAIGLFKEAFELSDDKWGKSGGLAHLGSIYLGQGNYDEAARYFEEGLALSREIGNKLAGSTAFYGLAMAAQGQGDHERAAQLYTEGLKSSAEVGDQANTAYCLDGLAQVAAAQGEVERAARLFGAAEASLEAAGGAVYAYVQDRSLHEQAVAMLRSRWDQVAFSAAWAKGSAMSRDAAFEYALSGEEPAPPATSPVPGSPRTSGRLAPLTHRQEEITLLIARGLTNRQIATELSISEYTAATHVARILKKLDLHSRSQLTTWVLDQELP